MGLKQFLAPGLCVLVQPAMSSTSINLYSINPYCPPSASFFHLRALDMEFPLKMVDDVWSNLCALHTIFQQ